MKIRFGIPAFVLIAAMNVFGVNMQLDNGVVVQTYIGTRPTSESGFGVVVLDGELMDSPDPSHTGYLDGVVETTTRASVNGFAGMTLSSSLTSTTIRRVTQISSGTGGAPDHFVRYYRITNNGSAASGTMTFNFVTSGNYNETNSVPSPWVIWGDGDYWNDNPVSASPLTANVTIPAGNSAWLGVENVITNATIFAKVFLEGPYRTHLQQADPGDTMFLKLRHSPRSEPPDLYEGDSVIPVVSPYPDQRNSGYADPNNMPEKIVDWVYLRFRPGGAAAENSCFVPLGNGFTGYSCYLRNDGCLVDVDGSEGVTIPGLQEGEYYIFVAHRNHLTVASATAPNTADLTDYTTVGHYYDFTTGFDKFYEFFGDRGAHAVLIRSKSIVGAGDGPYNGQDPIKTEQIEGHDESYWFANQGLIGYEDADYNLGIEVEGFDLNTVKQNSEVSGQLRSPLSWPQFTPDTCP